MADDSDAEVFDDEDDADDDVDDDDDEGTDDVVAGNVEYSLTSIAGMKRCPLSLGKECSPGERGKRKGYILKRHFILTFRHRYHVVFGYTVRPIVGSPITPGKGKDSVSPKQHERQG